MSNLTTILKKYSRKSFYKSMLLLVLIPMLTTSCFTAKYSMSGASISPEMKTFSVLYFQNRAPKVQPTLSQRITDALRDKCRSNTSLRQVNELGDANFEGEITYYDTRPTAIQSDDIAANNRFTISIRVKFTNSIDPKMSFDQTFSRYKDYSSEKDFSSVEDELTTEIIELLTEDVFNKAFVNW